MIEKQDLQKTVLTTGTAGAGGSGWWYDAGTGGCYAHDSTAHAGL